MAQKMAILVSKYFWQTPRLIISLNSLGLSSGYPPFLINVFSNIFSVMEKLTSALIFRNSSVLYRLIKSDKNYMNNSQTKAFRTLGNTFSGVISFFSRYITLKQVSSVQEGKVKCFLQYHALLI